MSDSIQLTLFALATVGTLLTSTGCGNLTAGGATGEASVLLSGNAVDPIPMASLSAGAPQAAPGRSSHGDEPEGEVEAEFQLFLLSTDGLIVPLTDGDVRVRVDLQGLREPVVADQVVDATTYSGFRIVFTRIEAEIDTGLIINGVPVTGAVEVKLDHLSLTVDRAVDLDIGGDDRVVLVVDLNAASWLQAVDPATATVDEQVFADLITVVVR